ncbi:MAG TPA: DUF6049 family protein [Mycobacteriales bacterium]|nr:DUF6049 family protein [Mycobacteriales bacterium]
MRLRRGVAALACACGSILAASLPATASPTPVPNPSVSAEPVLPVAVTLTRLRPFAPQPGQTLELDGSLRNVSAAPVDDLQLHLVLSRSKVGSRGEFDGYAATPDGPPPADAVALPTATATVPRPSLPPAGSEPFHLAVKVDDLHLPQAWQVYEFAITVTGTAPAGLGTLGRLRSFLPWAPVGVPGVGKPTQLAWVWPLVDRPHRNGGGWTDDGLASAFATGGRLDNLLRAAQAAQSQQPPPVPKPKHRRGHRRPAPPPPPRPTISPVPVTWAIDPMLVEDAALMERGYRVGAGAAARPGHGQTAARAWLAGLKTATSGAEVLALPYADPDVTAAVKSGLTTEVQVAATTGQKLLGQALRATPLPYSWPPDGFIDQRALDAMFATGITTVVLDSAAVPYLNGEPSETPGAHTTIHARDGNPDALLADHVLTATVDAGAFDRAQGPLDIQRVLSELLMIQAEQPFDQRSFVIAPGRRWNPAPAYAATLLAASGQVPWIQPVPLSTVAATPADTRVERGQLTYPASERQRQLSRNYLDSVRALKHKVDALAAILPPDDGQANAYHSAVLRLLSSAWRNDPATARGRRASLLTEVTHTMSQVYIASHEGSLVTLTSHSGTVPVTVANDLDTPVRVEVRIDRTPHLQVRGGGVTQTIPPHRRVPVDVRAAAQTSGVFPLTVRLYTPGPEGERYGDSVQLFVKSTAYGTTALLITGGATAVLLLAVALRLGRRAVSARRHPAA